MAKAVAVLVAGCTFLLGSAAVLAANAAEVPGFTAESVTYREGGAPRSKLTLHMGPEGHRLENIPPRGITLIAPAAETKRWMLDPDAQVYAVDTSGGKGDRLGGLLAHEPCKGFPQAERLGTESLNSYSVAKWRCRHPDFGAVTQWFAPRLATVIKDRSAAGEVQELRNIQEGPQPAHLFRFQQGESWKQVPVIELFR